MIHLFRHAQWEHQPIHLHGVCVKEVVNDLRHQLSATLEHVPNLGQVGLTELVRLEFQSHRRLRTACPDRSSLTKVTERPHPAQPHTEIPVIHISNHIIEPIHEHTHNVEYVPGYTVPRQRWIQNIMVNG